MQIMEHVAYSQDAGFGIHGSPEDVYDAAEADLPSKDIVEIYQRQIAKVPIPDPIEIRQLAEFIQNGKNAEGILQMLDFAEIPREDEILQIQAIAEAGKIANGRLVIGHLRFAAHVARLTMGWVPYGYDAYKRGGESIFRGARIKNLARFASAPLSLSDRIQLANMGLMKAAGKYKPDKGATFTTYAMYAIEKEIERAIAYDRNIKVPINVLEALAKTAISPGTLQSSTFPEIEVIGWGDEDPITRRRYIQEISIPMSLEELEDQSRIAAKDNEDSPSFYETLDQQRHNPLETDTEEKVNQSLRESAIRKALDVLPERERRILELRFGFDSEPWTLENIGHELDLTRERVRQLEGQALSRLASLREFVAMAYTESDELPSEARSYRKRLTGPEVRLSGLETVSSNLKLEVIKLVLGKGTLAGYNLGADLAEMNDAPARELKERIKTHLFVKELYQFNPELIFAIERMPADGSTKIVLIEDRIEDRLPEATPSPVRLEVLNHMLESLRRQISEGTIKSEFSDPASFNRWLKVEIQRAKERTW